jgi:hypothetical protein
MVMANRSKKTVLSVRVSGYAKSCLDVLAAIEQKSLPDAIEGLLEHAFDRKSIAPPAFIRQDKLSKQGEPRILLGELMRAVWTEDSELFKLRLHLIEPAALNDRDQVVTGTVFKNLDIFAGDDDLFDKRARELVVDSPAIPKLSLSLVSIYWPLLNDYARFLANNSLNLSFPDYVDMLRKSGELDEIFEVL